jgi:hypothetical protein
MAHILAIFSSLALLVGLIAFLQSMIRRHGAAMRAALLGVWGSDWSAETALGRIGTCLRVSFPTARQQALTDELSSLMLQLSTPRR